MYIDSHTHFDLCLENAESTEETLISGLDENGIIHSVQISIDVSGFRWSLEFARKYREHGILFTLGIHPSSIAQDENLKYLSDLVDTAMNSADSSLLFGIGEAGLDYYRMRQPKSMQKKSFEAQIALSKMWNLPLVVHTRNAIEDTLSILKKNRPARGIMHCFSGNRETAREVLDLGFHISFAGNLTYKNATTLHDVATYVPLNRLLLETDAPFLTPVPLRGKSNRPEYVIHLYEFIAELRNVKLSTLKEQILTNFTSLTER